MFIHTRRSLQNDIPPKARILTISSYLPALKTWHMLLESQGYQAASFVLRDRSEELFRFEHGHYDLIILGQSVDDTEKKKLVDSFRQYGSVPIISVPSRGGEPTDGADVHAEPDPEELLSLIATLIEDKPRPAVAS